MGKRLELDYIDISKVEFAEKTELRGSELYINKEELISQFDTSPFASVEIHIASPSDEVRIIGIHDSTQPRVKADAPETSFPGFLGKLAPAGDGRTVALRGVLVSELYPLKANIKRLLDMKGPIADISMLARHVHIVLDLRPKPEITPAAYCQAQKTAALKVCVWLASLGIGREPDEKAVYELTPVGPGPNFQEEAMIKELYRRHGKDIEFVGMIMTAGKVETTAKNVSSMMAAEFARDYLHADITINTVTGMVHCQVEQQMMHIWFEQMGMKAVSVMPGVSSEKPGDLLVISDPRVDAVVHSGDVKAMTYPGIERLIGVADLPALLGYDLRGPFTITTNGTVVGGHTTYGANYMTEDLNLKTTGWRMPTDE